MDLEREFQKLMDEVVQKIGDKQRAGEYSHQEADDLVDMVAKRRHEDNGWSSSTRACMDSYEYERDDEGWNRSGLSC